LLKRLNVDYFIDIDGINGGNYDGKLLKELRKSTVFVLFISFDSIQSKDVLQEVSTAQSLCNKRGYPIILPVYLDEIDNMEDNDLYFDALDENNKEEKLRLLNEALSVYEDAIYDGADNVSDRMNGIKKMIEALE